MPENERHESLEGNPQMVIRADRDKDGQDLELRSSIIAEQERVQIVEAPADSNDRNYYEETYVAYC